MKRRGNIAIANVSGFSLVELLMTVAISIVVLLGMSSVFIYGVNQFRVLTDQNKAEQALLEASYLVRNYLTQAVKTGCYVNGLGTRVAIPAGAAAAMPIDAPDTPPISYGRGGVDCRGTAARPAALTERAWFVDGAGHALFAYFLRENGGYTTAASSVPVSNLVGTTISFVPPTANGPSGAIWFSQGGPPTNPDTGIFFDHIVEIGVVNGTLVPQPGGAPAEYAVTGVNNNMQALQVQVVARYMLMIPNAGQHINYMPNADIIGDPNYDPAAVPYRDISMVVPIGFRDNFLGISSSGVGNSERLFGGMYFFRFSAPPLLSIQ